MSNPDSRRLRLWQGRIETEVEISGRGAPLVYFHGPWGLAPERGFVARLAESHTVLAPKFPGTSHGDPNAVHELADWHDLTVYHGELFDALELKAPAVIGASFGGAVAAEVAAAAPHAVGRLVLIDPIGLWRDDLPVTNWMLVSHKLRPATFFANPESEAAKRFFFVPSEPNQRVDTLSQFTWAQACTGKFVWPLADRGLSKRIHRIAAPSLILWGAADRIIVPAYAEEFARRIKNARVATIDAAGHLPHLEQTDQVVKLMREFLG